MLLLRACTVYPVRARVSVSQEIGTGAGGRREPEVSGERRGETKKRRREDVDACGGERTRRDRESADARCWKEVEMELAYGRRCRWCGRGM
jgi:hypothetical protein